MPAIGPLLAAPKDIGAFYLWIVAKTLEGQTPGPRPSQLTIKVYAVRPDGTRALLSPAPEPKPCPAGIPGCICGEASR